MAQTDRNRVANIRCVIRNGKAYLAAGERHPGDCEGECTTCSSFHGVDITQVGQPYLEGDCWNVESLGARPAGAALNADGSWFH